MEKKKIRIYGAGSHSQVIREIIEENNCEVTAIFDDNPLILQCGQGKVYRGVKANPEAFVHNGDPIILAVGANKDRAEISQFLKCNFAQVIHQTSYVAKSAKVGVGTVVFAGAIVQSNSVIGKHVIINTSASVDHDSVIEDYVHISPKVALCGHVEVGEGSHIGAGAVVIPNVKIGKWCTIGAGAVVLENVPNYSTLVGNPGRVIKSK